MSNEDCQITHAAVTIVDKRTGKEVSIFVRVEGEYFNVDSDFGAISDCIPHFIDGEYRLRILPAGTDTRLLDEMEKQGCELLRGLFRDRGGAKKRVDGETLYRALCGERLDRNHMRLSTVKCRVALKFGISKRTLDRRIKEDLTEADKQRIKGEVNRRFSGQ